MLFDHSGSRERVGDQAEGLRQLRRPEPLPSTTTPGSTRVLKWPRIVLISEFPSTDTGARFAFHLATKLGQQLAQRPPEAHPADTIDISTGQQSLLVDLAPAASRLPQVLADCLPPDRYPSLWSELAAGHSLATLSIGGQTPLAVAAEYPVVPAVFDQLPRLYEQLVRQLSRSGERWGWIVMLALDHIVPLDRACWQAADDIVLLGGASSTGCQRQAAAVRSRLSELEPERSLWTLPKRRPVWFGRRAGMLGSQWHAAGLTPKLLPAAAWPPEAADGGLAPGSRADQLLRRSAARVADELRGRVGFPVMPRAKTA